MASDVQWRLGPTASGNWTCEYQHPHQSTYRIYFLIRSRIIPTKSSNRSLRKQAYKNVAGNLSVRTSWGFVSCSYFWNTVVILQWLAATGRLCMCCRLPFSGTCHKRLKRGRRNNRIYLIDDKKITNSMMATRILPADYIISSFAFKCIWSSPAFWYAVLQKVLVVISYWQSKFCLPSSVYKCFLK